MKGGDPHPLDGFAQERTDTFTHLGRRLIREGNGEDLARPRLVGGDKAGDAVRQHPSLPRTCTRDNQQCIPAILDGLALWRVKTVNEITGDRRGT